MNNNSMTRDSDSRSRSSSSNSHPTHILPSHIYPRLHPLLSLVRPLLLLLLLLRPIPTRLQSSRARPRKVSVSVLAGSMTEPAPFIPDCVSLLPLPHHRRRPFLLQNKFLRRFHHCPFKQPRRRRHRLHLPQLHLRVKVAHHHHHREIRPSGAPPPHDRLLWLALCTTFHDRDRRSQQHQQQRQ